MDPGGRRSSSQSRLGSFSVECSEILSMGKVLIHHCEWQGGFSGRFWIKRVLIPSSGPDLGLKTRLEFLLDGHVGGV